MKVVLGSASPRRRELLAALIEAFEVHASGIPEPEDGEPIALARGLALSKARAVAFAHPSALVIGADTVVHDGDRPYGKPTGPEDAAAMLGALRGREHMVVTAVAVVVGGIATQGQSSSMVRLGNLTDDVIRAYVASGRPLDKAGAYAIQDDDVPTVDWYEGCYCSVVGLPLWRLRELLVAAGVACADPGTTLERCLTCPDRG